MIFIITTPWLMFLSITLNINIRERIRMKAIAWQFTMTMNSRELIPALGRRLQRKPRVLRQIYLLIRVFVGKATMICSSLFMEDCIIWSQFYRFAYLKH